MKTLNANLIVEKNKLNSASPFIWLFVLEVDDSTTLRLAAYPENVTFNSEEYTATAAIIESISDNSQGRLDTIQVHLANVDRLISAYVEQASLISRDVTVRIVHKDYLTESTCKLDYTYRINKIYLSEEVATFELGHDDLLKWQLPRQRYVRGRCRFAYQDDYCRYPGDEFDGSTEQDFADERTVGAPFEKLHGWYVLNPAGCAGCDVNISNPGYLTISNDGATPYFWEDATDTGVYVYKEVDGNFSAEANVPYQLDLPVDKVGVHFMVQFETLSTTGYVDWISWLWYQNATTGETWYYSTDAGVTTKAKLGGFRPYVRITRTGSSFLMESSQIGLDNTWYTNTTFTRTDATQICRVGFALHHTTAQTATPETEVLIERLHFLSGGLTNCDYTLNGANGCIAHKNQTRFGGAPAIPYGKLYGI